MQGTQAGLSITPLWGIWTVIEKELKQDQVCDMAYVWNLKKMGTSELIYKTEIDS